MHPDAQSLLLNLCTLQLKGPHGWVDVTAPECTLLHAFAASTGQRLATSTMLGAVGKAADMLGKRALEVQIVRLRKKIRQAGVAAPTIKSIRNHGYQLCIPLHIREVI